MKALHAMLLQADGRSMVLFPAWPRSWEVEFRLHAPYRTIVEGVFAAGKLRELRVSPTERQKDLVVLEPQAEKES